MKIVSKVTLIFLVGFISNLIITLLFYKLFEKQKLESVERLAQVIVLASQIEQNSENHTLSQNLKNIIVSMIKAYNLKISQEKSKRLVLGKTIDIFPSNLGEFRLYEGEGKFILLTPQGDALIIESENNEIKHLLNIEASELAILFLVYLMTIASITPLKELAKSVQNIDRNRLELNFNYRSDDEIKILSDAIKEFLSKIKKDSETRKIFLRAISHEIKTPITKGKLLLELCDISPNKEKFENVFNSLEKLLDELIKLEGVSSGDITLNVESFNLKDIIEEIIKDLQAENLVNTKNIEYKLRADKELFKIALKNLIENAIIHSNYQKIDIFLENNTLFIKNKSLQEVCNEKIFEPFYKKNSKGFGLGLYVSKKILELHEFSLECEDLEGYVLFKINIKQT